MLTLGYALKDYFSGLRESYGGQGMKPGLVVCKESFLPHSVFTISFLSLLLVSFVLLFSSYRCKIIFFV